MAEFKGTIRTHYMDSEPWWPEKKTADGKLNVLYILMDDTGYGDLSCFGSMIETPNIDRLAADGLIFSDFHVNAMCSPTRASLLSGCNHHSAGMGFIADLNMGFPNLQGQVPHSCGFISETLREEGYFTFCVGKWHLASPEVQTPAGPFDQWPCGRGFDKYYGFLPAETSQFYPVLINGNEFVHQPAEPEDGYHLSEDLVDHAISYIGQQKSIKPEKPFFGYVAFGAQHSPHQAPKEYIDKYKGVFDEGWDVCRRRIFERQKKLGLISRDAVLPPNDYMVDEWNAYTDEEKKIQARFMEVYAGFLSHTDAQVGRLIDYLKKIGEYDNTLIVYLHDNGASAEGGVWGTKNNLYHVFTETDAAKPRLEELSDLGSKDTCSHYPPGWAHVSNTPFRMYKSWSYCGGLKVPCIITCPKLIKDRGGLRTQYHHVVDINATVLDVLGIESPKVLNGVPQMEKHGISMKYVFDDKNAERRRHIQYYEMVGNRGLWSDGWKISADHAANPEFDFSTDKWELFNTDIDPTESHDLSADHPEKLQEMIALWWREAGKYGVFPMIESHLKRRPNFNSRALFRLAPSEKRSHFVFFPEYDMGPGPNIQDHSFTCAVPIAYHPGDEGVLFCMGDNMGGLALYVEDGRLKFHYNWLSFARFDAESSRPLPEGKSVVGLDFVKTGRGEGLCRLMVNGRYDGETAISAEPLFCTHYKSFCVGRFTTGAVKEDPAHKAPWPYTGGIENVTVDLDRPNDEIDRIRDHMHELITD